MNDGALDLIDEVRLRPGSIVQPSFPAALGLRGVTMMRNVAGLLGVMNVATGGKVMAAHSAYVIWYIRGRTDDGETWLMSDGVGVGYGARPHADGNDAIYLVAQENYPVESWIRCSPCGSVLTKSIRIPADPAAGAAAAAWCARSRCWPTKAWFRCASN